MSYGEGYTELQRVQLMLAELREMRDRRPFGFMRSKYNDVCDRLDVLESKIITEPDAISQGIEEW